MPASNQEPRKNETKRSPLERIKGHDCFKEIRATKTDHASTTVTCPSCSVTWWRRTRTWWVVLDMECPCGARAFSDDTSVEWYSDTECGTCWRVRA